MTKLEEFLDDYERRTVELCRISRELLKRNRVLREKVRAHDALTQLASTADIPSFDTEYRQVSRREPADLLREISQLIEEAGAQK